MNDREKWGGSVTKTAASDKTTYQSPGFSHPPRLPWPQGPVDCQVGNYFDRVEVA
jgi:hypothetical protein